MQGIQRFVRLLLVVAFVLLAVTSFVTVAQAAGKGQITSSGCWFEWRDTGMCCECWWPGRQDWRQQWLVCPDGRQGPLGYYKCACPSLCG